MRAISGTLWENYSTEASIKASKFTLIEIEERKSKTLQIERVRARAQS